MKTYIIFMIFLDRSRSMRWLLFGAGILVGWDEAAHVNYVYLDMALESVLLVEYLIVK